MIRVKIPGKFRGKGRPRFARVGNYVRTYTPQETANYENWVRMCWHDQTGSFKFDDDVALCAELFIYYPIPKSTSQKKRTLMLSRIILPTKRPDADNVAKTVLDSLNGGIAFKDDSQVTTLTVHKLYGEEECVILQISEDN